MSLQLAAAAKRLGSDTVIMDSYWKYYGREQNWFFSPNLNLDNAASRPYSFPTQESWEKLKPKEREAKWQRLSSRQRMTISALAGFGYQGKGINLDNSHHFAKLREGYKKWRPDLYSVFWSDERNGNRWLCNVFVGDAIYLCNKRSFTAGNKHYFAPRQIYSGQSFLRKRSRYKDVQIGDIIVFGTYHVEIITQLKKDYWIADDGFCSIGAGRAIHPEAIQGDGDGKPRCDTFYESSIISDSRELGDRRNSYYHL